MVLLWTVVYVAFRSYLNELFGLTTVQMLATLVIIWVTSVFNFGAVSQRVEFKCKKLDKVNNLRK